MSPVRVFAYVVYGPMPDGTMKPSPEGIQIGFSDLPDEDNYPWVFGIISQANGIWGFTPDSLSVRLSSSNLLTIGRKLDQLNADAIPTKKSHPSWNSKAARKKATEAPPGT